MQWPCGSACPRSVAYPVMTGLQVTYYEAGCTSNGCFSAQHEVGNHGGDADMNMRLR